MRLNAWLQEDFFTGQAHQPKHCHSRWWFACSYLRRVAANMGVIWDRMAPPIFGNCGHSLKWHQVAFRQAIPLIMVVRCKALRRLGWYRQPTQWSHLVMFHRQQRSQGDLRAAIGTVLSFASFFGTWFAFSAAIFLIHIGFDLLWWSSVCDLLRFGRYVLAIFNVNSVFTISTSTPADLSCEIAVSGPISSEPINVVGFEYRKLLRLRGFYGSQSLVGLQTEGNGWLHINTHQSNFFTRGAKAKFGNSTAIFWWCEVVRRRLPSQLAQSIPGLTTERRWVLVFNLLSTFKLFIISSLYLLYREETQWAVRSHVSSNQWRYSDPTLGLSY